MCSLLAHLRLRSRDTRKSRSAASSPRDSVDLGPSAAPASRRGDSSPYGSSPVELADPAEGQWVQIPRPSQAAACGDSASRASSSNEEEDSQIRMFTSTWPLPELFMLFGPICFLTSSSCGPTYSAIFTIDCASSRHTDPVVYSRGGTLPTNRQKCMAENKQLVSSSLRQVHMQSLEPSTSEASNLSSTTASTKSHSKWRKGKLLGRGTLGEVYLGFNSESGQFCAIKEIHVILDGSNSRECFTQLNQEIDMLRKLSHRNIVQYYGSELYDESLSIYLEYVSGGSVHKLIREYGPFREPVIRNYTRQILSGLAYLHGRNTVHRGIKAANLLVDHNGGLKIAEFGMAKHISSFGGSPNFMALGLTVNNIAHSIAVDIWSMGCTIIEMATAWHQYEDALHNMSKEGKDFLSLCLKPDPSERPSAIQLLFHPFLLDHGAVRDMGSPVARDFTGLSTASRSLRNTYRMGQIIPEGSPEPTNLPLKLLKDITEDFSDEREIGRGGFAVVYKGVLQDGIVAVKRLLNSHTINEEAFYRETSFLMSFKHRNIVRFLGFCAHTENVARILEGSGKYIYPEIRERLLCFEYMHEGSLCNHLTDELRGLEWHTRFQIIKGICEGLSYLHKENIIHRDLKPDNILLNALMVPKIADFGISKLIEGVTHATTNDRTATLGYCPPEYLRFGQVSLKSDIYSLGVIIIQLVTGYREEPNIKNVLRRWRYRWNKSRQFTLDGDKQVKRCIHVALRCMAEDPKRRPFIWDTIQDLNEMESTTEHIGNTNEPIDGQICLNPGELLWIEPLELHFPVGLNKQISGSLKLTNEGDDYIAFRIENISQLRLQYHIEPKKDVVPPRSRCIVSITLQVLKKAPQAQGTLCRDEFVVWSTRVNEDLMAEGITEEMFSAESGKEVDEVNLSVVFDTPPFA